MTAPPLRGILHQMKNRWEMDFRHAARPPPDKNFEKEAADVVVSWGVLLIIAIVLGFLLRLFGYGRND